MNSLFDVSKRGGRRQKEGENKRETETEGDREWDRQMGERDREKVKEGMGGSWEQVFYWLGVWHAPNGWYLWVHTFYWCRAPGWRRVRSVLRVLICLSLLIMVLWSSQPVDSTIYGILRVHTGIATRTRFETSNRLFIQLFTINFMVNRLILQVSCTIKPLQAAARHN